MGDRGLFMPATTSTNNPRNQARSGSLSRICDQTTVRRRSVAAIRWRGNDRLGGVFRARSDAGRVHRVAYRHERNLHADPQSGVRAGRGRARVRVQMGEAVQGQTLDQRQRAGRKEWRRMALARRRPPLFRDTAVLMTALRLLAGSEVSALLGRIPSAVGYPRSATLLGVRQLPTQFRTFFSGHRNVCFCQKPPFIQQIAAKQLHAHTCPPRRKSALLNVFVNSCFAQRGNLRIFLPRHWLSWEHWKHSSSARGGRIFVVNLRSALH